MKIATLDNEYKGVLFEISRGEKKSYLCPIVNGLSGRTLLKPKLDPNIVGRLKNSKILFVPPKISKKNEELIYDEAITRFREVRRPNQEDKNLYASMELLLNKKNTMTLKTNDETLSSLMESWTLFARMRKKVKLDRPKCVEKLISQCKIRGNHVEEVEQLCDFEGKLKKGTAIFEELEKNKKVVKALQKNKKSLCRSYKKGAADELSATCQKIRGLYKIKADDIEENQRATVNVLDECFQEGGCFVFLGALSFFYFREEIVQSLQGRGYSVERIFPVLKN